MAEQFNLLDPLGIFGRVKKDVDRIAAQAKLPPLPGPGGPPPAQRGAGVQRLLDPLGLFTRHSGGIGNPVPIELDGRLVELKEQARSNLITAGYSATLVDRALTWHDEWLMGLVRMMAPNDMDMQRKLVQRAYAEIAPRAERWMRGIKEAFGV